MGLWLQAYYRSLEQIDGLRHSVQFPKLESPPADFLEQMENYVREAPRHVSENGVPQNKKVSRYSISSIYISDNQRQPRCPKYSAIRLHASHCPSRGYHQVPLFHGLHERIQLPSAI